MSADWREFEQAIAALLQALDPRARVAHDIEIPDLDSGGPRQRDVWIETSFADHFAIKILVSCKRVVRKLSQQDLDAFIGELRSSGAHKGVLYCRVGYTKPALAKARRLGITCCVLLENQPPPIPEALVFEAYCLREQFRLTADGVPSVEAPNWIALLSAEGEIEGRVMPATKALAQLFAAELPTVKEGLGKNPPSTRRVSLRLRTAVDVDPLFLGAESCWRIFRARIEAWLVNGSYSFTEHDFKGSIATPYIDTWSAHPGPGWEEISAVDMAPGNTIRLYFTIGDISERLEAMASSDQGAPAAGHGR